MSERESQAFFSPGDACRQAIIAALSSAKREVRVCVFTISDDRISDALRDAHARGVNVRILTDNDKADDRGNDVYDLAREGLDVAYDNSSYHMHHKFALIDDDVLINGSFNWTRSASVKNEENIVLHFKEGLIEQFAEEFERLWKLYA